jgi:hypothetical protein
MIRITTSIITLSLCMPTILNAERSDVDMYATIRHNATLSVVTGPTSITHRRSNQIDPRLYARVTHAAYAHGIPKDVMHYHVKRESSYNPRARNPRSTATGLLQVVKGSHEAIIGRRLSLQEHISLMSDVDHGLSVGAAHIRGCMQLMPNASPHALWKRCHYYGHGNVGGSIQIASAHYQKPSSSGWLQTGSVAVPWSREAIGG